MGHATSGLTLDLRGVALLLVSVEGALHSRVSGNDQVLCSRPRLYRALAIADIRINTLKTPFWCLSMKPCSSKSEAARSLLPKDCIRTTASVEGRAGEDGAALTDAAGALPLLVGGMLLHADRAGTSRHIF